MPKYSQAECLEVITRLCSLNYRSILAILGKDGKKSIPDLHELVSKVSIINDIVWCYKNVETEQDKELKKIKIRDEDDSFSKWVKIHNIEYILYKEINRILGRTCDMLILEDFDALTPNIIASCIETVRGGGIILFIFDKANSVNEIISRSSDLVLESISGKTAQRFNRRLFKLLLNTNCAIFLDQGLQVVNMAKGCLQLLKGAETLRNKIIKDSKSSIKSSPLEIIDDKTMKNGLNSNEGLLNYCKTNGQRNTFEKIYDVIIKNEPAISYISASRGRGKSATMGLLVAVAIDMGLSSIFLSALFLENLQTIFDYAIIGLKILGYKNIADYKIIYSFEKKRRLIESIKIFKGNSRQEVKYICPFEDVKYYPDILFIDEAASIPINFLKKLLEMRLVVMASTIGGYEGTGRVLRTKLQEYITEKSLKLTSCLMDDPIRYAKNDPVEEWLNKSLILETPVYTLEKIPMPLDCMLMHVNKDLLFLGSEQSEKFLNELFSLFIASHYRNSPNDLQILSDSPNHEIFAMLTKGTYPRVVCAIQVAFEGRCEKNTIHKMGNLIPWVIYETFFDEMFLSSFGARIVRIATHPHLLSMGYGTAAMNALKHAFTFNSSYNAHQIASNANDVLLCGLDKIKFPKIDWIGSSFGIKEKLLNFWKINQFSPICIKQSPSKTTGEYSTIVIDILSEHLKPNFLSNKSKFMSRFLALLPISFNSFSPSLVLSILHTSEILEFEKNIILTKDEKQRCLLFGEGILDFRGVCDVLPDLSKLCYFKNRFAGLTVLEQSILILASLQLKSISSISKELGIEDYRVINLLIKSVKTITDNKILG